VAHTLQSQPLYKFTTISAVFAKIKALLVALDKFMNKRALRRQSYKELSSLSNRELRDIGLCRGDIMAVVNDQFYRDSIRERETTAEVNRNLKGWT
jgi:uncharacterized protein YjiS (DUF1127 family)|tara:strand:+ start:10628 stop:10915 length:288 start_codon:yes stop_codon:yes gene_type:complete